MPKSSKRMREFVEKLNALPLEGTFVRIRKLQCENIKMYADMVDQEWEILRLKVEQLKVLAQTVENFHHVLAYENVLKVINGITGE